MNKNASISHLVKSAPITIREEDNLALVVQVMRWGEIRHLPVVRGDTPVGVISERDVFRHYAEVGNQAGPQHKVRAVMSTPAITIGADESIDAAIKLVIARRVGCLPVLEKNRLIGVVTRGDLLDRDAGGDVEQPVIERRDEPAPQGTWTSVLVDAIMSPDPVTAAAEDSLRTIVDRMARQGIRHVPVLDGDRRVIGILSDRDVRTAIGNPMRALNPRDAIVRIEATRVSHAMSRAPLTIQAGTRLSHAAALFVDQKIGIVPVVDDRERLVGVVSYTDVLRAILGPKPNVS